MKLILDCFIVTLLTIAKKLKQPNSPSIDVLIGSVAYPHMGYQQKRIKAVKGEIVAHTP